MRDPQIAAFLQTWNGFSRGVISSDKPNRRVKLSEILETGPIPARFFLSPKACRGILRRAEKRGKTLPALLERALRAVADSERISTSGGYELSPALTGSGRGTERAGDSRGQDCVIPIDMRQASRGEKMTNNRAEGLCSGGAPGTGIGDNGDPSPTIAASHTPAVFASTGETSHCLNAGGMGRIDYETETLIASTLKANHGGGGFGSDPNETFIPYVTHALRADGFDASEDGTGRGTPLVPVAFGWNKSASQGMRVDEVTDALQASPCSNPAVAFSCKDHGADAGDLSPTLRAMGHGDSHANAGGQVAIAFNLRGRDGGAMPEVDPDGQASMRAASGGSSRSYVAGPAVRRLTPLECVRLQGFSDDYFTGMKLADGPIYKMLGNSMAVPVMRWIGERIQAEVAA